ncbi:MAG: phosphopantothenoylcysteine decarboxylase / phosphopantothenate---cysteine ligase [Bacteroidales bacterium]|jgi:phosphopantothenoylcysteine decarboxylase/phosphopantothenate--cysteine ligase|nr:phosphopantothenoylcysteine decarboxylase / phosphopantothenate---cysteine ligase [Bacteroidales bacterium]MDN5330230.1 phosphopantothenoylcysteine decarboxylase / phosphopantothenate---cysteine ligase [Bacteroidales bacterium]
MLKGKKIIIGITGSIAAYKIPLLVRLLVKEGAEVQVIMTPSACDFVTPLTLSTLSRRPVLIQPFNPENGEWNSHVDLGYWADLMLIAPATANTLGKMVNGLADNMLIATYLAAKCPVFFAPAMDVDMFNHPATQANIRKLQEFGHTLIAPQTGELASGLCGAGRLEEPEVIFEILSDFFKKKNLLANKTVLVSAGPTREPVDPVRFISNHSSGQMGYALAEEAAHRGARVILVTGPVHLSVNHPHIELIKVETAAQMAEACLKHFPEADITIMAAAVADFTPEQTSQTKIKKEKQDEMVIKLKPTTDILAEMGKKKKAGQLLIGFALETDHEEENALAKLKRKNADLIVMNSMNDPGATFGHSTNKVTLYSINGHRYTTPLLNKDKIAEIIFDYILNGQEN